MSSKETLIKKLQAKHKKVTTLDAAQTFAAKLSKDVKKPKSTVIIAGDELAPKGFGKAIFWDEEDPSIAVVAFVSSADQDGLMIAGVKAGDTIEFPLATGIASFSEDTENEHADGFISLVGAGAKLAGTYFLGPEVVPIIGEAEKFAKSLFPEKTVKTKRRDAFGEDPGTGHKAKQEGGVLICTPRSGLTTQTFTSGNNDHRERWIKEPGIRDGKHMPDHIPQGAAFFLSNQFSNTRILRADGDIIIVPWDHKFEDNFGFYRLHILLHRGNDKDIIVE